MLLDSRSSGSLARFISVSFLFRIRGFNCNAEYAQLSTEA